MGLLQFLVGLRGLFSELSLDEIGSLGLGFDRLILHISNRDQL